MAGQALGNLWVLTLLDLWAFEVDVVRAMGRNPPKQDSTAHSLGFFIRDGCYGLQCQDTVM